VSAPRSRHRTGRVVAVVAGVLFLGLVLAEVGGRQLVERAAATALRDEGIEAATVTVGTSWWRPTLVPALFGGSVDRVQVRLRDTEVSGVRIVRADYVLDDLQVDPDPLGRTLGVSGIGGGSFRLVVAPESVAAVLGVPARVVDGRLVIGPDREPAKVRVDRDELVVESPYLEREGIDPRIAVLDRRLLPCSPEVRIAAEAVELWCSGDQLPGILDTPLGEPVGDVPAPPELEPPVTAQRGAATATTSTAVPSTTVGG
jgi:hypothetical protein